MEWWRGSALAAVSLVCSFSLAAQIGDFENSSLRRKAVAEAFAPIFYQQESIELIDSSSGFHPVDSIVNFNFDGNQDLRDNAENVFLLGIDQARAALESSEIYYSVIESRSHFYLNYIVYHAVDTNGFGHAHDTENVFMIVKKTAEFPGELEIVITNSHGFPMVYAFSAEMESRWRAKIESSVARNFLLAIDASAKSHHESGELSSVVRSVGRSPLIFVHSRSHALYKFNSQAWADQSQVGTLYLPADCSECTIAPIGFSGIRKTLQYRLKDFDEMMIGVKSETDWSPVFGGWKRNLKTLRSVYRERELPGFLAVGVLEAKPAATLFFRGSFKTAYPLSDPVAFHRYFVPEGKEISGQYLLNAYLESP